MAFENTTSTDDLCATHYCPQMVVTLSAVSIIGLVANAIVMVVVSFNKKLHKPTFVAIAALCLCDFTFLLFRYIRYLTTKFFKADMDPHVYYYIKVTCDSIGAAAGGASIVHMVLLSILRYFMVVHPLKSHVYVTVTKIVLGSVISWTVMIANAAFYIYAVIINGENDPEMASTTNTVFTFVYSIAPLVIIGVFHVIKAKKLKASFFACRENTTKRMSRVVTVIIVSYIVTTTPINIHDILIVSFGFRDDYRVKAYGHVARVFLFLNYTINPFIYFIYSPHFKRYIRCKKGIYSTTSRTSSRTLHTNVDTTSSEPIMTNKL